MADAARRHFVEEALGTFAPSFDDHFPAGFDWRGLCQDAPAMAAKAAGADPDDVDRETEALARHRARRVFQATWISACAALASAPRDDEVDPGLLLDMWMTPPDDEAEARFVEAVDAHLGPLETHFAGQPATLAPFASDVVDRAEEAWPVVEMVLEEDGLLGEEERPVPGEEDPLWQDAYRRVLRGVARLALLLGVLRALTEAPDEA